MKAHIRKQVLLISRILAILNIGLLEMCNKQTKILLFLI